MLESLIKSIGSAVHRLRVRSALNPMLWLVGITLLICPVAAYVFREYPVLMYLFAVAAVLPVVVACLAFIGFAIWKPEMLRSEDYHLRHDALQIIQQKAGVLELDPTSLPAIANPGRSSLPSGSEDNP